MTVRPVFVLAAQTIGYRKDTFRIIVAQHWTGFTAGRHAFALSVNDEITGQRVGFPKDVERDYAAAASCLFPHTVTEEQARDLLQRQSRPRERPCEGCHARLPLGGLYCVRCGLPGGRKVAGPTGSVPFRPARESVRR